MLDGERTIQVNLHQADLLALAGEVVDRLFDRVAAGAHRDDHALGVRSADVIEQVVLAAGELANLLHNLFDDLGGRFVILVRSFAALEVDVGVLRGTLLMRMLRIQAAFAELVDLRPSPRGSGSRRSCPWDRSRRTSGSRERCGNRRRNAGTGR